MELSEITILVERAKDIIQRLQMCPYDALIEAEKQLLKEYNVGSEEYGGAKGCISIFIQ